MKTASTGLKNTIKQSLAVKALPRLIAEWNQNRYTGIQEVDNVNPEATHGYDQLNYPISSIVEPNRPTRGIAKGRVTEDTAPVVPRPPYTPGPAVEGRVVEGYSDLATQTRFYLVDEADRYKYWCSPVPTSIDLGGGKYGFAEAVQPRVIYTASAWSNKIVVTFETAASTPNDYDIQITTDGTTWSTIASDLAPDSKGQVTIYRQSGGTWGTTVYRDNPLQIRGIKLIVTALNASGAFFSLIEVSPRLESDLTPFVINYGCEFTMSEPSFVTPLGRASSNTAEINLSNIDGRFTNDNSSSLYYGIIDKNVLMTMDLIVDASAYSGSSQEVVRQFTMYVDDWSGHGEAETHVALKDSSKFMQEVKPVPTLFEEMTLGEIVWRLCDSIGFVNYKYDHNDEDPATLVPFFWVNDETTIWEVFSKLAETTQSAIYFDEYDTLQILTRNTAYDLSRAVDWELDAVQNGSKLPDIADLTESYNFEANSVDVKYRTTKISDDNNGFPQMEVVWQPEDTVVLRASSITEAVSSSAMVLRIDPKDATTWPFEGVMQIEGEFIRYKGKGYYYYNEAGVQTHVYLNSIEEQQAIDKNQSHVTGIWKNAFSGYFKITKRGEWNTTPSIHQGTSGYYARHFQIGSATAPVVWGGGQTVQREDSTMRLASTKSFNGSHVYITTKGAIEDAAPNSFGTRLKIDGYGYQGIAGMCFYNGANDIGYFVEITRTYACDTLGLRKYSHELAIYARYANGTIRRFGPDGGKGARMFIDKGVWYNLDIDVAVGTASSHVVNIAVNGSNALSVIIPNGQTVSPSGRSGLIVRGYGAAIFDYWYAITGAEQTVADEESFFDKVTGGWVSGQWDRDWVYSYRTNYKIVNKKRVAFQQKYSTRFFEEFGPIVHEVREYTVKFEKFPVVYSTLYLSNDYQVICPEYNGNAFGAKFYLANTARINAILNGEDTTTFGADNPVDQKMMIYGRLIFQEDEKSSITKSDLAIRRRGEVTLELSSDWIQSEAASKAIGEWITLHWAGGNDEINLEIFGNPLLQLGDMVSVNYPAMNKLKTTHKYFVVSIQHDFNQGYSSRLVLRRAKV